MAVIVRLSSPPSSYGSSGHSVPRMIFSNMVTNSWCPSFAAAINGVSPPMVGHLSSAPIAPSESVTRFDRISNKPVSINPRDAARVSAFAPILSVASASASFSSNTRTAWFAPLEAAQISGVAPDSVRHSVDAPRASKSRSKSPSSRSAASRVSGVKVGSCRGIRGSDRSLPNASSRYGTLGRTFSRFPVLQFVGVGHFDAWSKSFRGRSPPL
mmetsp:Transcript_10670/g.39493  ORF Transcript_10670/g.39493 Transcript_10670/m.39493 type:complete len:213 (-) Transcript_10670:129-767(-)